MARHYLTALQAVQPQGPYLLGGASFGGLVAFEMAQQLRLRKQPVDLLFLIDTPAVGQPLFDLEDDAAILAFVGSHLLNLNNGAVSVHELRTMPADEQIPYLLEQQNGHERNFTLPQLHHLMRVIKAHRTAMQTYAPQPYTGRMLFFRPQEPRPQEVSVRPEHFWADLAASGVEIYPIAGNHFTINHLPHVQTIAERLEQSLKRVEVETR
jgi:thioesterase domain-containing protein